MRLVSILTVSTTAVLRIQQVSFVNAVMNVESSIKTTQQLLLPVPQVIVAMGDSYASGNGAGNYVSIGDCYRSSMSWGAQLAQQLLNHKNSNDNSNNNTSFSLFINRGCSGGIFADITNDRYLGSVRKDRNGNCPIPSNDVPDEFYIDIIGSSMCDHMVQAQVLTLDFTVDLVLFAMGANDMQFLPLVTRCFIFFFRDARKCQDQINYVRDNAVTWTQNLTNTLIAMHAVLKPTARVIVLQYPHIVEEAPPYTYNPIFGGSVELTNQLRSLGMLLDESQREAITMANQVVNRTFVLYYDQAKTLFAGHEPDPRLFLKNPDGWFNESWKRIIAEIYHFNQMGHAKMAKALHDYIVPLLEV